MIEPEVQKEITRINRELEDIRNFKSIDHFHTGFDVSKIKFEDIARKKFYIHHNIVGTDSATAANYSTFYINEIDGCIVSGFWEVHTTAGSDAGAVTVGLEKLTGTTAPGSGVSILASELSLKGTANTVQKGTLTGTLTNLNLAIGDRLALEDTGVLTAVANVSVIVELTLTN